MNPVFVITISDVIALITIAISLILILIVLIGKAIDAVGRKKRGRWKKPEPEPPKKYLL